MVLSPALYVNILPACKLHQCWSELVETCRNRYTDDQRGNNLATQYRSVLFRGPHPTPFQALHQVPVKSPGGNKHASSCCPSVQFGVQSQSSCVTTLQVARQLVFTALSLQEINKSQLFGCRVGASIRIGTQIQIHPNPTVPCPNHVQAIHISLLVIRVIDDHAHLTSHKPHTQITPFTHANPIGSRPFLKENTIQKESLSCSTLSKCPNPYRIHP